MAPLQYIPFDISIQSTNMKALYFTRYGTVLLDGKITVYGRETMYITFQF